MVKNKEKELFDYHIYPPYIDAYINSFWDKEFLTLNEIKQLMKQHALEWGYEVIGRCTLEGKELPKFNDKIVLCCGSLYQPNNVGNGNSYLIVVNNFSDNWYSDLEFIEGDIQNEWNVT